jgi:hypothetical protein
MNYSDSQASCHKEHTILFCVDKMSFHNFKISIAPNVDLRKKTPGSLNTLLEFENCHYLIKEGSIGSKAIRAGAQKIPSPNSTRPSHGNVTTITWVQEIPRSN